MSKKGVIIIFILFLLALSFVSARNFTIYNSSNPSQLYFSIDGTNGNVGIGAQNTLQKLHVVGNILANGTINATTDVCIQGGICLSGVATTAYIGTVNTSMYNYVNLQNTSQNNWISGAYNTTRNNYLAFVNTSMRNYVNYQDLNYNTSQTNAMAAQNTSQVYHINTKVNKSGDTMTGNLNLSANVNLTMNGGNQIGSNVTCIIIKGLTSRLEIC